MSAISVAIISQNTLVCIGIKHILQELFNISPSTFKSWDNNISIEQDNFDLYIIDSQFYVLNIDFFIPRRNKTLVIINSNEQISNTTIEVMSSCASVDSIIEQIGNYIEQIKKNHTSIHNELSQREIDVLKLIANGCINKEIADRLSISINTVLTHRKNITAKLGIRSVSGLSFYAMMNGYVNSNI